MNYIEKFSLFVVTLKVYILADLEPAQFLYIYNSGQLSSWCNPRKYSTIQAEKILASIATAVTIFHTTTITITSSVGRYLYFAIVPFSHTALLYSSLGTNLSYERNTLHYFICYK